MSQWSVIVYSRTYEADYRFLAIPEDFTREDENWAISYIKATTRKPEQLPGNPRWSLFKNHKHCVIGVTCMVKDLISSQEMTADKGDRPIYAFVGYVTKVDKNPELYLDIPHYADNISLFQSAYNSVKDQWLVTSYQLRIKPKIPQFPYRQIRFGWDDRKNSQINRNFLLNMDVHKVGLWQNSYQSKWGIWESACFFINPYEDVSLCLGMPREKDVLDSPFLNATVPSVNHHILKRVNPQGKNPNQENIKKRRKERYKKNILNRKERISGAAIGVVIWGAFLFQWMVIAIIIGGIIGFIVVFLLQKYRRIKTKFPLIITKIKKKFEKKIT
jgi:hypothetical protein